MLNFNGTTMIMMGKKKFQKLIEMDTSWGWGDLFKYLI
jgi:hypothetical protein